MLVLSRDYFYLLGPIKSTCLHFGRDDDDDGWGTDFPFLERLMGGGAVGG
jgi:hypothetical protein